MKSLINFYDGKIIHQRLGKTKHKFTNLHLFLLINISKIKSCNMPSICRKFSLFSINKFNILSLHINDHGNRNDKKIEIIESYERFEGTAIDDRLFGSNNNDVESGMNSTVNEKSAFQSERVHCEDHFDDERLRQLKLAS